MAFIFQLDIRIQFNLDERVLNKREVWWAILIF